MPTTRGYIRLDTLTLESSDGYPTATIGGLEYLDDEMLSIMPPWAQRALRPVVSDSRRMSYRYIRVHIQEAGLGIHVQATCYDQPIFQYFHSLAQAIHNQWPDEQNAVMLPAEPMLVWPPPVAPVPSAVESTLPAQSSEKDTGPTLRIRERFAVFKRLKDAHPEWTQDKLALEATRILGELVTKETVRNAYRRMGQEWVRGDRVR